MQGTITVHSFAPLMGKFFKHIITTATLLILSANMLFSNNLSNPVLISISNKADLKTYFITPLCTTEVNFYTQEVLLKDDYIKKAVVTDTEEDVEHLNCKKNISQLKLISCHFKQQLPSVSLSKNSAITFMPIFYLSKKATSLYLLFEVFRI